MRGQDGTSGVDWGQVTKIGDALLLSPLFGFVLAALLLLVMKFLVREPALYTRADRRHAAAAVDPRPAGPHLHAACRSSTAPTTARRAWASSC